MYVFLVSIAKKQKVCCRSTIILCHGAGASCTTTVPVTCPPASHIPSPLISLRDIQAFECLCMFTSAQYGLSSADQQLEVTKVQGFLHYEWYITAQTFYYCILTGGTIKSSSVSENKSGEGWEGNKVIKEHKS